MNYSKQQLEIFNAVKDTDKNIVVSATAGSGKSTTLIKCGELIPRFKSSIFVAFNKSIVEELKLKLPNNVQCSTIHSLGMKTVMSNVRSKINITEYKSFTLADPFCKKAKFNAKTKDKDASVYKFNLQSIYNFIRCTMVQPTKENITSICDKYGISPVASEIEDSIKFFNHVRAYNDNLSDGNKMMDFTDMIYLPLVMGFKLPTFDVVLLDESQDFSNMQKQFVEKITNRNGRQIIVGDPRQAIYGFTGSEVLGFNTYELKPNTLKFPLSTCYRCGKDIIKKAQEVYSDIQPFEEQIDGEVIYTVDLVNQVQNGDMIICRNLKPLIITYFELLSLGKKACILGKDIESGLIDLIKPFESNSIFELNSYFVEKIEDTKTSLIDRGVKNPDYHPSVVNLDEKIQVIKAIQKNCDSVKQLIAKIKNIFFEQSGEIKMMSIHKSKGLEADNVFFIEKFEGEKLIPSKYATDEDSKIQEKNLLFVAYTRAKKKLYICNI